MMRKLLLLVSFVVAAVGCDKPSEDACRGALTNMQALLGTETTNSNGAEFATALRSCKGGSTKESVACATKAKSIEDLEACQFMHIPDKTQACTKALAKVKALRGSEGPNDAARCKTYARKIIQCAADAANAEEVEACGFLPTKTGSGS